MIALACCLGSFQMAAAPGEDPVRGQWFPSGEKTELRRQEAMVARGYQGVESWRDRTGFLEDLLESLAEY